MRIHELLKSASQCHREGTGLFEWCFEPEKVQESYSVILLLDNSQTAEEEARRQLHKNVESNTEQVLAATLHKTPAVRPLASHHKNYTN